MFSTLFSVFGNPDEILSLTYKTYNKYLLMAMSESAQNTNKWKIVECSRSCTYFFFGQIKFIRFPLQAYYLYLAKCVKSVIIPPFPYIAGSVSSRFQERYCKIKAFGLKEHNVATVWPLTRSQAKIIAEVWLIKICSWYALRNRFILDGTL